ncbi:hypothetical protein PAPYR_4926 [Paratrimastix pyriformis]|uniref:Uncharacterized protein n=1 Tax=Paratrimastix pyriformis TaxID=342808 RepID=A0ABQ8UK01_9EUKA|nr:hypothetical protein PAPYR_4926 [Paratrimastix pyriformis]
MPAALLACASFTDPAERQFFHRTLAQLLVRVALRGPQPGLSFGCPGDSSEPEPIAGATPFHLWHTVVGPPASPPPRVHTPLPPGRPITTSPSSRLAPQVSQAVLSTIAPGDASTARPYVRGLLVLLGHFCAAPALHQSHEHNTTCCPAAPRGVPMAVGACAPQPAGQAAAAPHSEGARCHCGPPVDGRTVVECLSLLAGLLVRDLVAPEGAAPADVTLPAVVQALAMTHTMARHGAHGAKVPGKTDRQGGVTSCRPLSGRPVQAAPAMTMRIRRAAELCWYLACMMHGESALAALALALARTRAACPACCICVGSGRCAQGLPIGQAAAPAGQPLLGEDDYGLFDRHASQPRATRPPPKLDLPSTSVSGGGGGGGWAGGAWVVYPLPLVRISRTTVASLLALLFTSPAAIAQTATQTHPVPVATATSAGQPSPGPGLLVPAGRTLSDPDLVVGRLLSGPPVPGWAFPEPCPAGPTSFESLRRPPAPAVLAPGPAAWSRLPLLALVLMEQAHQDTHAAAIRGYAAAPPPVSLAQRLAARAQQSPLSGTLLKAALGLRAAPSASPEGLDGQQVDVAGAVIQTVLAGPQAQCASMAACLAYAMEEWGGMGERVVGPLAAAMEARRDLAPDQPRGPAQGMVLLASLLGSVLPQAGRAAPASLVLLFARLARHCAALQLPQAGATPDPAAPSAPSLAQRVLVTAGRGWHGRGGPGGVEDGEEEAIGAEDPDEADPAEADTAPDSSLHDPMIADMALTDAADLGAHQVHPEPDRPLGALITYTAPVPAGPGGATSDPGAALLPPLMMPAPSPIPARTPTPNLKPTLMGSFAQDSSFWGAPTPGPARGGARPAASDAAASPAAPAAGGLGADGLDSAPIATRLWRAPARAAALPDLSALTVAGESSLELAGYQGPAHNRTHLGRAIRSTWDTAQPAVALLPVPMPPTATQWALWAAPTHAAGVAVRGGGPAAEAVERADRLGARQCFDALGQGPILEPVAQTFLAAWMATGGCPPSVVPAPAAPAPAPAGAPAAPAPAAAPTERLLCTPRGWLPHGGVPHQGHVAWLEQQQLPASEIGRLWRGRWAALVRGGAEAAVGSGATHGDGLLCGMEPTWPREVMQALLAMCLTRPGPAAWLYPALVSGLLPALESHLVALQGPDPLETARSEPWLLLGALHAWTRPALALAPFRSTLRQLPPEGSPLTGPAPVPQSLAVAFSQPGAPAVGRLFAEGLIHPAALLAGAKGLVPLGPVGAEGKRSKNAPPPTLAEGTATFQIAEQLIGRAAGAVSPVVGALFAAASQTHLLAVRLRHHAAAQTATSARALAAFAGAQEPTAAATSGANPAAGGPGAAEMSGLVEQLEQWQQAATAVRRMDTRLRQEISGCLLGLLEYSFVELPQPSDSLLEPVLLAPAAGPPDAATAQGPAPPAPVYVVPFLDGCFTPLMEALGRSLSMGAFAAARPADPAGLSELGPVPAPMDRALPFTHGYRRLHHGRHPAPVWLDRTRPQQSPEATAATPPAVPAALQTGTHWRWCFAVLLGAMRVCQAYLLQHTDLPTSTLPGAPPLLSAQTPVASILAAVDAFAGCARRMGDQGAEYLYDLRDDPIWETLAGPLSTLLRHTRNQMAAQGPAHVGAFNGVLGAFGARLRQCWCPLAPLVGPFMEQLVALPLSAGAGTAPQQQLQPQPFPVGQQLGPGEEAAPQ